MTSPAWKAGALDRFLIVQKAQVVFTPLAYHHLAGLDGRVGVEARQLVVELFLQVLGVGADPDRAAIAFGPDACRGDIAKRLAGAGACFRQHQMGASFLVARAECLGGDAGVGALLRAVFGIGAGQLGQLVLGFVGTDRHVVAGCFRHVVLPFRQSPPDPEAKGGGGGRRFPQRGEDRRRPRPTGASHVEGDGGDVAVIAHALSVRRSRRRVSIARMALASAAGPACLGTGRSSASARPRTVGAAGFAGWTKANSSSRSKH